MPGRARLKAVPNLPAASSRGHIREGHGFSRADKTANTDGFSR